VFLYRCDSSAHYRSAVKRDISLFLTISHCRSAAVVETSLNLSSTSIRSSSFSHVSFSFCSVLAIITVLQNVKCTKVISLQTAAKLLSPINKQNVEILTTHRALKFLVS